MQNLSDYFVAAGEVWAAYFAGKLSGQKREAILRDMRKELPTLQPSHA